VTVTVTVTVDSDSGSDCGSDSLVYTYISGWTRMGQGKGVVASFWLVPENTGSWSFLQVGA
jgi:hypothetical protein